MQLCLCLIEGGICAGNTYRNFLNLGQLEDSSKTDKDQVYTSKIMYGKAPALCIL